MQNDKTKVLKSLNKKDLTGEEDITLEILEVIVGLNAPKSFLRPQKFLFLYNKLQGVLWQGMDNLHLTKRSNWPEFCYVPLSLPINYAAHAQGVNLADPRTAQFVIDHKILFMIGTWAKTQGIYRFDETIFEHVTKSSFEGILMVDILTKLPEWCSYIEFPYGVKLNGVNCYGFYAMISYNEFPIEKPTIDIIIDSDHGFHHRCLLLDSNFDTMIDFLMQHRKEFEGIGSLDPDDKMNTRDAIKEQLSACINCLFYLCSQNAEITHSKKPEKLPKNPKIQKIKGESKILNADHPNVWNVAYRQGADLRKAIAEFQTLDKEAIERNSPRPHIRKAHFHGYWMGSRETNDRKYLVRWLANIFVNVTPDNPIVPTIRQIKAG